MTCPNTFTKIECHHLHQYLRAHLRCANATFITLDVRHMFLQTILSQQAIPIIPDHGGSHDVLP